MFVFGIMLGGAIGMGVACAIFERMEEKWLDK